MDWIDLKQDWESGELFEHDTELLSSIKCEIFVEQFYGND